ncbi:unnamed protein product, partial [Closterium sp. NIES-54]
RRIGYLLRTTPGDVLPLSEWHAWCAELLNIALTAASIQPPRRETEFNFLLHQATLPVALGELGLTDPTTEAAPAYLASTTEARRLLRSLDLPATAALGSNSNALQPSTAHSVTIQDMERRLPPLALQNLRAEQETPSQDRLQRALSQEVHAAKADTLTEESRAIRSAPEMGHTLRLVSLRGEGAGAWLQALPLTPNLCFSPMQFRTALAFRMGIRQNVPTVCECGELVADCSLPNHLLRCSTSPDRTRTHNQLAFAVAEMAREAQLVVYLENAMYSPPDDPKKADVIVRDPDSGETWITDTTITEPVLQNRDPAARKPPGWAAREAQKRKERDYYRHTEHVVFCALAVETYGANTPPTTAFLKLLATAAARNRFRTNPLAKTAKKMACHFSQRWQTVGGNGGSSGGERRERVGESGDECEGKNEGEREGKIDGEIKGEIGGEREKESNRQTVGGNGGSSGGERREGVTICEGDVDGEEELVQVGCDGKSVMGGGGSSGGEKDENRGSRYETSCERCGDGQEKGAVVILNADEEDSGGGRAREERSGVRWDSAEEEQDGNREWNGKSGLGKACEAVNGWTEDEGNTDRRGGESREGSQEGAGREINHALDEREERLQENEKTAKKGDEKNGAKQSDAEKCAEAHPFTQKPGKTSAAVQSSPEKQSPSKCPSEKESPATATVYLPYGACLYGPEYSFEAERGYAVWPHGHVDPRIMASFAALWHLFVYGREPRHHPIACASVLYCWGISHPALHPLRPRLSPRLLACLKAALDGIHARCCAVIDGFGSLLEEDEEELAGLLERERKGLTRRVGKTKNVRRVVEGGGKEGPGEGEQGQREETLENQESEGSDESEESESEESEEEGGDKKGGIAEREARESEVVLRYRIGRKRLVGALERRLRRSLTGGLKGMGGGELEERAVMGRLMEGGTMW